MFKNILISTDFSESSRFAVGKGIQLARLCNANVELVHVVSNLWESLHAGLVDRTKEIPWEAEMDAKLDLALPDEAYPHARKTLLRGASIPAKILDHAITGKFDLIVCGTHGRGFLGRTLLGSVAQELSRNSSIPVLMVPPNDRPFFSRGMERVLVPTDFSLPSLDALNLAMKMGKAFQASVLLLHAIYLPVFSGIGEIYPPLSTSITARDELKANAITRLQNILNARSNPPNIEALVLFGEPAVEILRTASDGKFNCIVMGTHGRKGLERAVLGSVTTSILTHSRIPIFTIAARLL